MIPELPPLILNSLPKSGTHLLARVFEGLPRYTHVGETITTQMAEGREDPSSGLLVGVAAPRGMKRPDFMRLMERIEPAKYLFGHLPFTPATRAILERKQIKMIVIMRDPRAVVCSDAHFIVRSKNHRLHKHFAPLPTMDAQLALAIRGMKPGPENDFVGLLSIAARFESVARWTTWPGAVLVLFEELIGPRGGGSTKAQLEALNSMLDHVGYDLDEQEKEALCQRSFSPRSVTFRKGQISDWKNYFNPDLEKYFETYAGDTLRSYLDLVRCRRLS